MGAATCKLAGQYSGRSLARGCIVHSVRRATGLTSAKALDECLL